MVTQRKPESGRFKVRTEENIDTVHVKWKTNANYPQVTVAAD
jgi:hypothetical protein